MASSTEHPTIEFQEYGLTVYSDGTIHRSPSSPTALADACPCPPNPSEVASTDITLNATYGTWLRLFLPPSPPTSKLPILLYFHGGGFMHFSTALLPRHAYLCRLAAHTNTLVVSVNYRLAPEHPLPAAYEDCFEALLWLNKQASLGHLGDPWLANHGDFSRCFLVGDSAGGTIAHYVAMQALGYGSWETQHEDKGLELVGIKGMLLFHPFFTCGRREGSPPANDREPKVLKYTGVTADHPLVNPLSPTSPPLAAAPLPRTIVFVAGLDVLKQGGIDYYQSLVKAGKEAKFSLTEGETHVFHVHKPNSPKVVPLLDDVRDFIHSQS